jgi:hypothetical protein
MRRSRKNPLVFDNRFAPDPMKRYKGSRVVASIVAPPRQRAQVERLADSPHTFRVVVVEGSAYAYAEDLYMLSKRGCITLILSLGEAEDFDLRSHNMSLPKNAGLALFSAFTFLHRMGDAIYPAVRWTVLPDQSQWLAYIKEDFVTYSRIYVPGDVSKKTHALADELYRSMRALDIPAEIVSEYIVAHTNSQMARENIPGEPGSEDIPVSQCVADWIALTEMPSARARPGRGEPWLLFPPKPGEYEASESRSLRAYADIVNARFPPFIQSLLDDLDGAVIRI